MEREAFAFTSLNQEFDNNLIYDFVPSTENEFYNTGIMNYNYNGEMPTYLRNIYGDTVSPLYNSEYGANIIEANTNGNMSYMATQNAPSNAPTSFSSINNTNTIQNNYGGTYGSVNTGTSSVTNSNLTGVLPSNNNTNVFELGNSTNVSQEVVSIQDENPYKITSIEEIKRSDGSVGTLEIPSINLKVKAYDGDTYEAMKKGVGHVSSTSYFYGNVGIVGHNRGTNTNFEKLKSVEERDSIYYETELGTKEYIVKTIEIIDENDWSYLKYTTDNRITLITCVEDNPSVRLMVQAIERN